MGNSSIKMDMEEFLNLSVQDGRVGNSTSENRMCVFNMNQPLQVKDNNLIGITLLPVRSYFLEIAIYPLAVVDQATNILELRSDNLQVPAMGFLPNSTQLVVSLSISSKETLDIVSLQPLQLESWSIVSFDIVGNKATLEILSSISPQFSFKQEIILPQKRSLVTSVSIYGASPSWLLLRMLYKRPQSLSSHISTSRHSDRRPISIADCSPYSSSDTPSYYTSFREAHESANASIHHFRAEPDQCPDEHTNPLL